ncbi:MAG TPA: 2-oxoglutarate dehydrogenase complex dihydrolipoyllysine-residue succinyltransferase [Bacteroidia bacterium]|jgi:2-oxoglutarate dehydrogenase E2 component (dihydrolipoamide succinyltransferase)
MALIQHKVPSPGESITEVTISRWLKNDGDYVEKDEPLAEIDSDKATLTVNAEDSGGLKIMAKEGETVKVGQVVCTVDNSVKGEKKAAPKEEKKETVSKKEEGPSPEKKGPGITKESKEGTERKEEKKETYAKNVPSPSAKKLMDENKIEKVNGTGKDGRITKADVLNAMSKGFGGEKGEGGTRDEERKKMTPLRKKLAQRLVSVKNTTAMLTTFNEVDMSAIYALRAKYNPQLEKQYGTKLGFMSFFTKAVCEALQLFPAVNAMIDGDDIVFHKYCDVGIAVSAPKGLVVPVLRNAEMMSLAEVELKIKELATKARDNKIELKDMEGGTFTITNGGVFGSLMSTPIINPPQSAILGMHNVVERPVAVNGKVEIRPMMYVALSYDHRIIDGRESVGFLVKVKEMCESPVKMLFGGKDPNDVLVGL